MWYSINRGWNFDRSLKFALLDRAEEIQKVDAKVDLTRQELKAEIMETNRRISHAEAELKEDIREIRLVLFKILEVPQKES